MPREEELCWDQCPSGGRSMYEGLRLGAKVRGQCQGSCWFLGVRSSRSQFLAISVRGQCQGLWLFFVAGVRGWVGF